MPNTWASSGTFNNNWQLLYCYIHSYRFMSPFLFLSLSLFKPSQASVIEPKILSIVHRGLFSFPSSAKHHLVRYRYIWYVQCIVYKFTVGIHVVYWEMYTTECPVLPRRNSTHVVHDIREFEFPHIPQYTHCSFVLFHVYTPLWKTNRAFILFHIYSLWKTLIHKLQTMHVCKIKDRQLFKAGKYDVINNLYKMLAL